MRRSLFVMLCLMLLMLSHPIAAAPSDEPRFGGIMSRIQGRVSVQDLLPTPGDLDSATAYVYKHIDGTDLKLYVFEPERQSDEPLPAVVFFFGGAWTTGRITQFVPQSEYLVSRGMVAIVADYRVALRHGTTWFDSVRDAKSTIRWVREHADLLGIDLNRIVAAGGSAGGHLAAAAALVAGYDDEDSSVSARPDALVLFNPALDLTVFPVPAHWSQGAEAISPQHLVREGAPPTLIMHGTADATVPFAQAVLFCEAMTELGNTCELEAYPGRSHGFFNFRRNNMDDFTDTLRRMDEFLVSLGYLEGS